MSGILRWLLFAVVAISPSQDVAHAPDEVAAEREANLVEYRSYQREREYQFHRHPAAWLAIAAGKRYGPAATVAEVDALARTGAPNARHRFVFRIGEDGDTAYDLCGATADCVVGLAFQRFFEFTVSGSNLRNQQFEVDAPRDVAGSNFWYLKTRLRTPSGEYGDVQRFVLSSAFTGFLTLGTDDGAKLGLELWEIPGTIEMTGVSRSGRCRRARLVLKFEGTEHEAELPVAVWIRP